MTAPNDAEVAARLKAILGSDAFHKRASDYVQDWLEKLPGLFRWLKGLPSSTRWGLLTVCLLFLAVIALQLYLGLRPERRAAPERRGKRWTPDVGEEPAGLVARAATLAEAGRLREAARALHQAALLRLTRERGLPWRAELADWEWVAALRDVRGLAEFTRSAQRLAYGPDPDRPGYQACEALYRGLGA